MADDADTTQERAEREGPALIAASKKPEAPKANGFCLSCAAPVADNVRFCDADCRDDYEIQERHKKINGK